MKTIFIGSLPPPLGGVTVKNGMITDELTKTVNLKKIDFGRNKIVSLFRTVLQLFLPNRNYIFSIGSNKNLFMFSRFLLKIFPNKMKNIIILMAGGSAPDAIVEDSILIRAFMRYRKVFVESSAKTELMRSVGLMNVEYYPNARLRPVKIYEKSFSGDTIRYVYYSKITEDKGAGIAVKAFRELLDKGLDIELDFWGDIDDDYKLQFMGEIEGVKGICYRGIFNSRDGDVYELLSHYHVMLLLTRCQTEGVPGALIESIIAGTPAIVTDWNVNPEIIQDGYNGYLVPINNVDKLKDMVELICRSKALLYRLSENAKKSGEMYYFENYIDNIIDLLD